MTAEPLGDWLRREVLPRLTLELVYGDDVRRGRAGAWLTQPCPLHGGDGPNFHVHPETLAWCCHSACQASGDVVAFVERRDGVGFVEAARWLAELVGEELPGNGRRETSTVRRSRPAAVRPAKGTDTVHTLSRPAPTYRRPPAAEVLALWNGAQPVTADDEAAAYLAGRAIDPARVDEQHLARVLPPRARLPRWARHWHRPDGLFYRLVFPVYSATGGLEALRARPLVQLEDGARKALAALDTDVGGLLLADALGRRLLLGDLEAVELVRRTGLWIAEGEADFLTLATEWSDGADDAPAVFGLVAGAWTPELAARVPDGARVVLATDTDEPGDKYAKDITRTLADRMRDGRVTVKRWRSRG